MSAAFYNKYKSLFFDDNDPEPLSMNYFGVRPKNSINIHPSQNIASLAQHYNIIPKETEIPRSKVEELSSYSIPKPLALPSRLDPLPYKPQIPEPRIKLPSLEYSSEVQNSFKESPHRNNSIQRLPPIQQESFKSNLPSFQPSSLSYIRDSNDSFKIPVENSKSFSPDLQRPRDEGLIKQSSFELKKQNYENTKSNIFPDKPDPPKQLSPYQEALKNRKEAKNTLADRREKLRSLLAVDKMV